MALETVELKRGTQYFIKPIFVVASLPGEKDGGFVYHIGHDEKDARDALRKLRGKGILYTCENNSYSLR